MRNIRGAHGAIKDAGPPTAGDDEEGCDSAVKERVEVVVRSVAFFEAVRREVEVV